MSNRVRARHRSIPQDPLPLAWPEPAGKTSTPRRCRSCGARRPSPPSLYCTRCEEHREAAAEVRSQAERAQQLLNEVLRRFQAKARAKALTLATPRAVSRPRKPSPLDRSAASGQRRA